MNTKKLLILLVLLLSGMYNSYSHALWIETSATGKPGQKQDVKIYYGEYALNERDSVAKWYSNVKDFNIWLVGPEGQKTQLTTVPSVNYFQTSFTPDKEGVYTLIIAHEAKDLGGTTKYEFLSSATVSVGKKTKVDASRNLNALKVCLPEGKVYKINAPVTLSAFLNDQPAANKTVTVFSPTGWQKEFKTDEKGIAGFTPEWPGRYLVEISNYEKAEGEHEGKPYKAVWKGSTHSFEVK